MNTKLADLLKLEAEFIAGSEIVDNQPNKSFFEINIILDCEITVAERLREAVKIIRHLNANEIYKADDFPAWLADKFSKDLSRWETEQWIEKWRNLPDEKKAEFEEASPWQFQDWLYWQFPEKRTWHLRSFRPWQAGTYRLTVLTEDWPTPLESLKFLLRCAGVNNMEFIDN